MSIAEMSRSKKPKQVNLFDQITDRMNVITQDFAAEISRNDAKLLLSNNERNRYLKAKKVLEYTGAMDRGEWIYNADPIRISPEGRLLDGQHRLTAFLDSGKQTLTALIAVVGEPAQETMDRGNARTFFDFLSMRGESYSAEIAAATRLIYAWEKTGIPASISGRDPSPTIQQLFDCLNRNPEIRQSASANLGSSVLPKSQAVALHYLFSQANPEDADTFFDKLKSGEGLAKGDPILVLRNRLLKERDRSGRMTGLHGRVKAAFAIRAWNYWRNGESIATLTFRPGGARPDRFPAIDGVTRPKLDD